MDITTIYLLSVLICVIAGINMSMKMSGSLTLGRLIAIAIFSFLPPINIGLAGVAISYAFLQGMYSLWVKADKIVLIKIRKTK